MALDYAIMKKLLAEQQIMNELLRELIAIQQPKTEVVSNTVEKQPRGPRRK